jgi:hypothetical protein
LALNILEKNYKVDEKNDMDDVYFSSDDDLIKEKQNKKIQ